MSNNDMSPGQIWQIKHDYNWGPYKIYEGDKLIIVALETRARLRHFHGSDIYRVQLLNLFTMTASRSWIEEYARLLI